MKAVQSLGLGLGLLLAATSSVSMAGDGKPGSGPNPFRDCGIGAALFPDTHWAAVTSNVIWDVGTTAVTSATASPETCSGKGVEVAQFIVDSYDNVIEDMAQGTGEHFVAMLQIYGCGSEAQAGIMESVRPQAAGLVAEPSYRGMSETDRAERFYFIVDAAVRSDASGSCSA